MTNQRSSEKYSPYLQAFAGNFNKDFQLFPICFFTTTLQIEFTKLGKQNK